MSMNCPLCGNRCSNRRLLPRRGRVVFGIVSGFNHLFDAICSCFCWPINSFQRCQTSCFNCFSFCCDLLVDWYYRPPTARQFYASKTRTKGFNQQQQQIACINNDREIEMTNLCELSTTSSANKIPNRAEQTPEMVVIYAYLCGRIFRLIHVLLSHFLLFLQAERLCENKY